MSDLFSSLTKMFSSWTEPSHSAVSGPGNSQEDIISLNSFYQGYRQCRSNHERSVFVANHCKYLKWQLSSTHLSEMQTVIILERCVICKTLGEDVAFAGIHAIQLAQSSQKWYHKVSAYKTCCELLDERSEMSILMVSTLQRDLRSRHIPSICIALSISSSIISAELVPSVDALVCERLKHPAPTVRRRAIGCLGAFLQKQPELIENRLSYLRTALTDKDPATMAITLQVYDSLPVAHLRSSAEDLLKPLLFILSQVVSGNLPKSFMRSGVCGPHIITKLVSLLHKLSQDKEDWKQKVQLAVLSVIDRYETVTSLSAAMVVTDCCIVLPLISDDKKHLTRVKNYAERLLKSSLANYNNAGLKILKELIKFDKGLITSSQNLIVSALNSTDPTNSAKAMSLIIQLTTPTNIQSVYELYSKISGPNTKSILRQQQGLEIITSCLLKDISMEWFTEKLINILCESVSTSSDLEPSSVILNTVLTYISAENIADLSLDLHNCLKDSLTEEMQCLDILSVMLWLRVFHRSKFVECNSECVGLIMSTCLKATNSSSNVLAYLTAMRSLLVYKHLVLKEEQVKMLKHLVKCVDAEASCYCLIEDISELVSASTSYDSSTSPTTSNTLWADMLSYSKGKISSNSCRPSNQLASAGSITNSPLQFNSHTECKPQTLGANGEDVMLKSARTVWTAKGRVKSVDENIIEKDENEQHGDSDSAPTEFGIEEDETATTANQLASHIFSSLGGDS